MTKIDAVITWVDGADPEHRAARLAAMQEQGWANNSNGTYETRFSNLGEIYYCIASILKYAPFINRIYVVTASQVPEGLSSFPASGLCSEDRIVVVDHTKIFQGIPEALPTFNSLTIETMLWAIPNLSEYFLYFNDDVFLNAPIARSDLIGADGKIVLRGKMRPIWPLEAKYRLRNLRCKILRNRRIAAHFKTAQMHAAKLAGLSQYLEIGHHPHIIRRRTFCEFFAQNPDVLARQLQHKFRSIDQFLPVGLANHLEIASGNAVVRSPLGCAYLRPQTVNRDLLAQLFDPDIAYGCVQSLDEFEPKWRAKFMRIMRAKFASHLPADARSQVDKDDQAVA
ncbi:stealth family protein [Cereibacter sediminicola]|uniref:stealth family protein n=1 Tax=Cereibacter sediminicola TaxID=2584941 RepID=UPI0011A374FA|nr:stealth family protein [Cereibacter sediminicola]